MEALGFDLISLRSSRQCVTHMITEAIVVANNNSFPPLPLLLHVFHRHFLPLLRGLFDALVHVTPASLHHRLLVVISAIEMVHGHSFHLFHLQILFLLPLRW